MLNQVLRRTANWAIQDEEILPSKVEREKAEMAERRRKLENQGPVQAPG
jgi:hypothetical protein